MASGKKDDKLNGALGGGGSSGPKRTSTGRGEGEGPPAGSGGGDPLVFSQHTIAPTLEDYFGTLDHVSDDETVFSMVSFYIGDDEYAVEAGEAVEVAKPRPLTEVPRVPDFIEGVLSLRGEMIMVLDMRKRLGMEPLADPAPERRILIVRVEGEKAGLLVDRVAGIIEAPLSLLEPAEGLDGTPKGPFVRGTIHLGGKPLYLLSIERLMALDR